jgi:hypothetical protein
MPFDEEQRVHDLLRDITEWSERCARHVADMSYSSPRTRKRSMQ